MIGDANAFHDVARVLGERISIDELAPFQAVQGFGEMGIYAVTSVRSSCDRWSM